jgi:hypothetical protein
MRDERNLRTRHFRGWTRFCQLIFDQLVHHDLQRLLRTERTRLKKGHLNLAFAPIKIIERELQVRSNEVDSANFEEAGKLSSRVLRTKMIRRRSGAD